jgi:hypothetical protein
MDAYTTRLEAILAKKLNLIHGLQEKLAMFKLHLQEEEKVSKRVAGMNK